MREQVATITLNRPDVRNAFGAGMGPELDDALQRCDEDDDIRAVVLTGTPPAFCSGADLARGGETFGKVDTTTFNAAGLRFPPWDVRKPVIGAINGHAIGVGMTLAIQCDLRFMAADAKYGVVQTQRGVMGDAFVHWSLPRIVGMANAAEILLTGRTFDGNEMLRLGVANRVLAADEVLPAAWEYAREMAVTTAPMSVAFSKRVLWASFDLDRDDVNHLETVLHHHLMGSPRREGRRDGVPRTAGAAVAGERDRRLARTVARRGTGMSFETTTDEVLEGVDLRGKIAVVTGASTGLGLETARALASVGAQVVLAGRDSSRIDAAAATILETEPDAMLEQAELDLTSLDSVRGFADWYASNHDRLHLLINNAGVMYTPFEHTAEGFEMQFGTNHVGHFLLTGLLVPLLLADPPSRVVNLSSGGHRGSDIVWDDINFERREYDKFAAYGQSKTANILFSVELDRRLGDRGVHAYAVHPGMIATELGRHMSRDDFAQHGGPREGGAVRRTAAAQDRRTGRSHERVGGHRVRARRAGRHVPRRRRGHRRPRALGPRPRVGEAALDPERRDGRPDLRLLAAAITGC